MKIKIDDSRYYIVSSDGQVTYKVYLLGVLLVKCHCGSIGVLGVKALKSVDISFFNLLSQLKWFELQGQTFNPNVQATDWECNSLNIAPSVLDLRKSQKTN
jgi:hypothetical protein